MGKNLPAMQETRVQALDWEGSLRRERQLTPIYFGLKNPMDRGAWQTTDHEVTQSQTRLSDQHYTNKKLGQNSFFSLVHNSHQWWSIWTHTF